MPRGLQVIRQEKTLSLVYRHHRAAGLFLLLAGLFWLAMLPLCFRVLAGGGFFGIREAVAFLPFLVIALGLSYVGLAKVLNRSRISLSPEMVQVSHQPIPWFRPRALPLASIKDFQVKRDLKPRDIRHRVTVALVADLSDGRQVPLLRAISDSKAARKMHQEATSYLQEMQNSGGSAFSGEGSSPA
jgi:hypothetical protein